MKHWMKSAAFASGLLASSAFADPRDVLKPQHSNHGAIARSNISKDGTAKIAERAQVPTERVHIQTQAQQAALGGDAASERVGDDSDVQNKSAHKSSSASKQQLGIKLGQGDNPSESDRDAKATSASGKLGKSAKGGERPHFSASQLAVMGSTEPNREDTQSNGKAQPASQQKTATTSRNAAQLHLAPQVMQEMKPEGAGETKAGASSHGPSFAATEARFERSAPESRAGVLHHAEQPQMRMPQAFYH
jgi:hypothetical protein